MSNPRGKIPHLPGPERGPRPAGLEPRRPAPPAVYRPEQGRAVVQPAAAQNRQRPVAPPAYRPQPQPKCLQAKTAEHAHGAGRKFAPRQTPARPTINPARTPPGVVQPKHSAALNNRPPAVASPPATPNRPLPPGPRVPNGSVVQREPGPVEKLLTGRTVVRDAGDITKRIYSFMPTETLSALSQVSPGTRAYAEAELEARNNVPALDLDKTFRGVMTTNPLGPMKGLARSGDKHVVSQPRPRDADRKLQFLTQLSVVLFSIVKLEVSKEQEVQCMELNGKLVITTNDAGSITALWKFLQNSKTDQFVEVILDKMNELMGNETKKAKTLRASLPMLERKAAKMYAATQTETNREGYISRELAMLLRGKIQDTIEVVNLDQCAAKLIAPGTKILLLHPGAYHAEQNFALLLAGYTGDASAFTASVAGKKRPCASCLVTLKMLCDFWRISLMNIPNGGHYFTPANPGLQALIDLGIKQFKFTREQINAWLEATIGEQKSHTSKRKHYDGKKAYSDKGDTGNASESESEDDDAREKLRQRKKRRTGNK